MKNKIKTSGKIQNKANIIVALVALIAIVSLAGVGFFQYTKKNQEKEKYPKPAMNQNESEINQNDVVLCTQDAKQCQDGSFVSRTGPKCEFAPCSDIAIPDNWRTYSNEQFSYGIKYPDNFEVRVPTEKKFVTPPMEQRVDFYSGAYNIVSVMVFPKGYDYKKYDQSDISKHEKINVSGFEADRIDEETDVSYFSTITILGSQYIYQIAYTDNKEHQYLNDYEKMLSAIKIKN